MTGRDKLLHADAANLVPHWVQVVVYYFGFLLVTCTQERRDTNRGRAW